MKREEMHKGQHVFMAGITEHPETGAFVKVYVREYVVVQYGDVQYRLRPVKGGMSQGGWWRNSAFYRKCFITPEEAIEYLDRMLREDYEAAYQSVVRLGNDTRAKQVLIQNWREQNERERDHAEEDPNAQHDR